VSGSFEVPTVSDFSIEGSTEELSLLWPAVFTGADDVDDVTDIDDDSASLDASSRRCNSAIRSSNAACQYIDKVVCVIGYDSET